VYVNTLVNNNEDVIKVISKRKVTAIEFGIRDYSTVPGDQFRII
jgi:hypothetical protein